MELLGLMCVSDVLLLCSCSNECDLQSDCNLFSFSLQRDPQRTILEKDGVYHIDEVINKFIKGTTCDSSQSPT